MTVAAVGARIRGLTYVGAEIPASYDPKRPYRYLEVRGTVEEMTEEGVGRHLDELASKYMGRPVRYFGECIPARFAETEFPVLCRIRPTRVVALDATGDRGGNPTGDRGDPRDGDAR